MERAITLDSAKDTFYGTFFTIIGILVTILAIFFGINIYFSRKEAKRQLKDLTDKATQSLQKQHADFEKSFNDLAESAKKFQEEHQEELAEALKAVNKKVEEAPAEDAGSKEKLEIIRKEIERIEKKLNQSPIQRSAAASGYFKTECPHCGKSFSCNLNDVAFVSTHELSIICPRCGKEFSKRSL